MNIASASSISLHNSIVEDVLSCHFTAFHFCKWNAEMTVRFEEEDGEELIPREPLITALKTAMMDSERFWTLVLRNKDAVIASVSFGRNPDDETIEEFQISTSKKTRRFGCTKEGRLLLGESPSGWDLMTWIPDDEVWGEFFSMIAEM